jgi:hypothetical protein
MRQKGSKPPDNWHRLVKPLQPKPRQVQTEPSSTLSVINFAERRGPTSHRHQPCTETIVTVRYRVFGHGSEDWNRGLRDLKQSYVYAGCITRHVDGAISLRGLPCGELLLDAAHVKHCLSAGLKIASSDFEAEIPVDDFRAALAALPTGGVIAFRNKQ